MDTPAATAPIVSLIHQVAALIQKRGKACADDLLQDCKGYTRAQVVKALQNCAAQRLVHPVGFGPRTGRGRLFVYAPGPGDKPPPKPRDWTRKGKPGSHKGTIPRVSSVWELGAAA